MQITIENLSKSYGRGAAALDQVNLNLSSGHSYGLLGKNGAGKTTLINLLIDLIKPSQGEVRYDGKRLPEAPDLRYTIGVMSDVTPPVGDFTGWQNLEFAARLYHIPADETKERVGSLMRFFFEAEEDWHKPVKAYSTGMRRKIGLCCAIVHKPSILIMDEPFSGLDPFAAKDIVRFVQQYQGPDRLLLTSSHDLDYLNKVVDRIIVIDQGKVLNDSSLAEFTEHNFGQIDQALYQMFAAEEKPFDTIDWLFRP